MNWKEWLEVNPAVLVGKPIIKGTHESALTVAEMHATGLDILSIIDFALLLR
ncbi:MAG: DUF433 domain-containing protein [Burkholderiales bacterium]